MAAEGAILEAANLIFCYGVVTAVSLALVILIHEFGHYLAARAFGIKITKFSIGFGKEWFGRTDRRGTRWSLSRLPIGGYVSIFGDVDPDNPVIWDSEINAQRTLTKEELKDAFCTRKVWQRMIVVAAGPGINILLALTLLAGIYMIRGVQVSPPIINGLAVGTASYDAGFKIGDRILEMDGRKIKDFKEIYKITLEDWINPHEYKVLRDGAELTITMTAREAVHTDFKGREWNGRGRTGMMNGVQGYFDKFIAIDGIATKDDPDKARELLKERLDKIVQVEYDLTDENRDIFLGIYPSKYNTHLNNPDDPQYDRIYSSDINAIEYIRDDLFSAYGRAGKEIYQGIVSTAGLFAVLYKGRTEERGLGGVLVVGKYVGSATKEGISNYIQVLVMLSIGIALINILPIPLLDGGFMVFLLYEALTGRRISPRLQNIAFAIALAFLGGIMIIANLVDLIYFIN